jgi:two-component system, cell cycle sensor histidine kinase and response regulator CckA
MDKDARILVVDDHEDNLKLLELKIRSLGHSVMLARDGVEALEVARKVIPDVVLLDIKMPVMDGFEVCRRFKSEELLKDIPIIFLTALTNESDLVKGLELGGQDYMVKPFEIQELAARLKVALRIRYLQQQIMEENKKLEAILESIPEGILTINQDGIILQWNKGAEYITGYILEEAQGKDYRDLIKIFNEKKIPLDEISDLERIISFRQLFPIDRDDLYLLSKERRHIPVTITFSPIVTEGKVSSVVIKIQDITRQKEIEKMKEDLLMTISHDLKTPLFAIRGFIEMILNPKLKDDKVKQEAILQKIRTASVTLIRLINNLLFIQKAGSGIGHFNFSEFSLGELTNEIVETFGAFADERDLDLKSEVPGNIIVHADREKLEEVFYNLINNAIKFSKNGGSIRISAEARDVDVRISITDTGKGIAARDRKKIFQKFYQVKDSKNGHGLGLYICDRIIKGHGSKIMVESTEGEGSRFYFSLKKAKASSTSARRNAS